MPVTLASPIRPHRSLAMSGGRSLARRPSPSQPDTQPRSPAAVGPRQGALTRLAATLNGGPTVQRLKSTAQTLAPNRTGLPAPLKSGIESLSGLSMDHVRVHYNSARPASIQAHAYAQGADIHLGPGQERHLPHEAWHVVQQAQGRVKPTIQAAADGATIVPVNDDPVLEREADRMGAHALSQGMAPGDSHQRGAVTGGSVVLQAARGPRRKPRKAAKGHGSKISKYDPKFMRGVEIQNNILMSIKNLYISEKDKPEKAYLKSSGKNSQEITQDPGTIYPRHTVFAGSFSATFLGAFYQYKVDLISRPSAIPNWLEPETKISQDIQERIRSPFNISRITLRSDGSAMGRPVGGNQLWGINASYVKNLGHLDLDTPKELQDWGIKVAKFPETQFCDGTAIPSGMIALPAPQSQPFVFYIHKDTPLNGQSAKPRALISASDFEAKYTQNPITANFTLFEQSRNSFPHKTDRQTGRRDPGTVMGVPAWSLAVGGQGGSMGGLASHEWCHLVGDGDGGNCAPDNLVIGTNSVNTEQLAMETALRSWRPGLAKIGRAIQIRARALATRNSDGTDSNHALHILYELSLVDLKNGNSPIPIIKHSMDAQRGVISTHEYEMLHAIVNEKIKKINKDHGLGVTRSDA